LPEQESLEGIIFSTGGEQKKGRSPVEVEATGESSGGIVPFRFLREQSQKRFEQNRALEQEKSPTKENQRSKFAEEN
jgi:hypothetical protein